MALPMTWQEVLRQRVEDPAVLCQLLDLDPACIPIAKQAGQTFALRVPRTYIARMKKGDPFDPLLQQILPRGEELQEIPGFVKDPLREREFNPIPGLLHKYHGRVLLTLSGSCAINCRYCFRRHFPYESNTPSQTNWQTYIDYIERDPSIHEVIWSGGDPLMLKDEILEAFILKLACISHLQTLRVHTRLPVVIPQRMTEALVTLLTGTRLRSVMVLHINHPQEIDESLSAVCARAFARGLHLLNQSVLLKGINDDASVLIELSEALFRCHVLPYYLHQLDPVQGAHHFQVETPKAVQLWQHLLARLPGYLVPKLVKEVDGAASKRPLF